VASDLARRKLGAHLRDLRESAGKTTRQLAAVLDMSQSTLSRIEHGKAAPTWAQVRAWAAVTGASDDAREALFEVAEVALAVGESWRQLLQGKLHLQDIVRETEASARMVRTFQQTLVPGLLETPEYARYVITLVGRGDVDPDTALAGRLARQAALHDPTRRFDFLLTEAALRWRPAGPPSILAGQLDRVLSLSVLPNVIIGVLPSDAVAVAAPWVGFAIYDNRGDDPPLVTVELPHTYLTLTQPEDVAAYRALWDEMWKTALTGEAADEFLRRLAAELKGGS
jgi:transcriptional regulator with XRE-family HTH domain